MYLYNHSTLEEEQFKESILSVCKLTTAVCKIIT